MALLFENKITGPDKDLFIKKVNLIANGLGYVPSWLMLVMYSESAGTFSASIKNPYSSAVGLIQFTKSAATDMGTTVEKLAKMDRITQLDYVYKYYAMWKKRGKVARDYADLYLITFYPYAVGKSDSYVIGSEKNEAYTDYLAKLNPVLDPNKDNDITIREFKDYVYKKYVQGVVSKSQLSLLQKGSIVGLLFF